MLLLQFNYNIKLRDVKMIAIKYIHYKKHNMHNGYFLVLYNLHIDNDYMDVDNIKRSSKFTKDAKKHLFAYCLHAIMV